MRGVVLAALLMAAGPVVAQDAVQGSGDAAATTAAQPRTLADLRADLTSLGAELKSLRAELNASGAAGFQAAGGDSAIDRMNAMEREIARLTGETERLRNRIDKVVRDGTNRIGDIEFRLCEMEDGCDLGALTTPTLGDPAMGDGGGLGLGLTPGADPAVTPQADVPLTREEKADFQAASAALAAGDFAQAAALFGAFAAAHAGSPAAPEALFLRGAALDSAGDAKGATAAWLQAFAAAPTGPRAPDALLGLSRVSAAGRPASQGCVYLDELTTRFAGTPQADEAAKRAAAAGCDPAAPDLPVLPADPAASADPDAAADLADGG